MMKLEEKLLPVCPKTALGRKKTIGNTKGYCKVFALHANAISKKVVKNLVKL